MRMPAQGWAWRVAGMNRRDFLSILSAAVTALRPLPLRAQQDNRVRRIGVLQPAEAGDRVFQARLAAFQQELVRLGWNIGGNVRIDTRWATTDAAEIRRQAAELAVLAP